MSLEKLVEGMKKAKSGIRKLLFFSVLGAVGISGLSCSAVAPGPRGIVGCLPCPSELTVYLGEDACEHERGIGFTCRYGPIDMAHLRKYAKWTEYLAGISLRSLKEGKGDFRFSGKEPVKYYVKINYPSNWRGMEKNRKQEIIENAAVELGAYLAHKTSIWHETLTWFGWNSTLIIPEQSSAFSWEDLPSDSLGCYIGKLAMQDKEHSFGDAMKILLEQELDRLEIQPRSVNIRVVKDVAGIWYEGYGLNAKMLRRNLDIGIGDNKVSPCIPPGYTCGEIWNCPVPTLGYLESHGFSVDVRLRPIAKRKEILRIAGENGLIDVETDFPAIMEYIERQAVEKGYIVNN